ncbi:MAG TPA: pseudouridine synthase [Nitrospirota bacterium]|nr:pseudouridine synthase [Nitrospirota bacterium]
MALERIQKILSSAGICSRREAEALIIEGKVKVNGHVVSEMGFKADPEKDTIKVGNRVVRGGGGGQKKLYLLMNKPKGFVSTLEDPEGRKTVIDLLGRLGARVYPVGRLDYDTEGLLLLTNDGDFANAVMHPSREVPKTYEVKVHGVMSDGDLRRLAGGIKLPDGVTAPAAVAKMKLTDSNSWIRITIHEGRYRQVRRMCEAVGHQVLKIKRTKVGPLDLRGVPLGMHRELTPSEVSALLRASGKEPKPPTKARPAPRKRKGAAA